MRGNRPAWDKIDPALIQTMRKLTAQGLSSRAVAARIGVSSTTVLRWLRTKV